MEINFEVTKEDYIKFELYNLSNSPYHKRDIKLNKYGMPIGFLCINMMMQTSVEDIIIATTIEAFIWLVIYPKANKLLTKREIENVIKEGDSTELFGSKRIIIDEESITIFNKSSTERVLKSAIKDVKIYDDIIVIYTSLLTAYIVPTRYLEGDLKADFIKQVSKIDNFNK
ncbi:YcxB family protein [Romboutsia lituseburensis]|uniref:YcxB-like protein n=1 Tax=Romboutsia lituseburensis DSM 797 TaxID=1121325 RepID=A0A1G9PLS4_9FIRM|nr:YcxB family protein [Romboutsia lituseburensis]CEH33434.1 YcxB-like protein [Romboutsia lituseburensis]SDL99461.1 YcxB-like protein [Romboutsia lituseburensis DSM 797]